MLIVVVFVLLLSLVVGVLLVFIVGSSYMLVFII